MIKVGERLPEGSFMTMGEGGPKPVSSTDYFKGRKVVLFGVPGAFTPTCDRNHLPGFLEKAAEIKGRGIAAIAVTGVNDVFVMDAWKKASGAAGKIDFLADGSGTFAKALGLSIDLSERGLGVRSQRYSMIVDDGVVRALNVEESPGKAEASGAVALLSQL